MSVFLLIAEDELEQQIVLEECITDCLRDDHPEMSFKICDNGHDLLEQVKEKRPQLIVLDVRMPEKDGVETLRALKADPEYSNLAEIPVVMLSSSNLEQAECIELGAEAYYVKEDELDRICEQLDEIVQRHAVKADPFQSFPGLEV